MAHRFQNRAWIAVLISTAVIGIGVSAHAAAFDSERAAPNQTVPDRAVVRMELIEEQYAFGPDESLHLVYRLTGDLNAVELTPPPPVPATTVPDTTVAPTTVAPIDPATQPAIDPAIPNTSPETTIAATTTTIPPIPPMPLTVEVTNYPPLTDISDIDDIVGGDVDRDAFDGAIDGVQIVDVRTSIVIADDGSSATLTLDVPTDVDNSVEERLKFERPGLYPIRTELLAGQPDSDVVIATHGTVVQRIAGPAEPSSVSPPISLTIMTAVAPAGPETTATDEQAKIDMFDSAIDMAAAVTSPVALQIPPPIVTAEAGTPDGSARLGASLTDDEFVAGPAMPLDVSSAAAAGKTEEFARQVGLGEDMLTAAVPTTPSRRNVWIATDPLSAAGAQELRDLGFRYLVMTDQLYRDTITTNDPSVPDPPNDLFVDVVLPDGGSLPLIVVDPLSDDLTTESTDDILTSFTSTEWAVRAVTEMLVAQADDQPRLQRSRVLSTPDLASPDPRLLIGLEALLGTTPSVEFTDASLTARTDVQTRAGEPVQVELPVVAGPPLVDRVALLDSTALSAASAGTMLPVDDPRPTTWAVELDAMISTALSEEQVAAATSAIQSEADAIRASVSAPAPFSFTLTGRSGDIELQLANTSDDPLTVILRASSTKLSFPESVEPTVGPIDANASDHEITLRPDDETSVIIPVRAKSNGTSPITVQLLTPAGEVIGPPVTVTATVTAFTGLGQVLTAGLVLVLLTWWATHWRSRRRAALTDVRERHPSGSQ